jgi:nicotinate phosphoribosyltransferase
MGAMVSDFGTRRRSCYGNHCRVIEILKDEMGHNLTGTSNLHMAHLYGLAPHGTQAHEWYMLMAALYGYKMANWMGLEKWAEIYQGDLGTALTDTYTSGIFFDAFTTKHANLFSGIRQDSGDPIEYTKMAVATYERLHIDSSQKSMIFSNRLNLHEVERILDWFKMAGVHGCGRKLPQPRFGIGTYLTNDMDVPSLDIVIKMSAVRNKGEWIPTCKLSDDEAKRTGGVAVQKCLTELGIRGSPMPR